MNAKKIFVALIILSVYGVTVAMAGDNAAGNATPMNMTNDTQTTAEKVAQPVQTAQAVVTQPPAVATEVKEKKFRIGPTVRIRPLNDVIKKDQDGLVELYFDNPSLNDVTLTVDARISVPSGIHVYGQGFGSASAAGMVYGMFEIPPGSARTINIVIKAEKTGDFSTQFTGTYYPDDNKDAYQPISLTHPFKVLEASADPNDPGTGGEEGKEVKPTEKSPGISAIGAIFVLAILGYVLRRR